MPPAVPAGLAAYLTERAESGIGYSILDGACSAITDTSIGVRDRAVLLIG